MKLRRAFSFLLLGLTLFFFFYGFLDLFHTRTLVKKMSSITDESEAYMEKAKIQAEIARKQMAESLILEQESVNLEMQLKECNQ